MKRAILLGATIIAAVSGLPGQVSAQAWGKAPWCAVIQTGRGSVVWDCQYASIETCRPNVIAGNRGFCNHNPAYEAPVEPRRRHAKRLTRRH